MVLEFYERSLIMVAWGEEEWHRPERETSPCVLFCTVWILNYVNYYPTKPTCFLKDKIKPLCKIYKMKIHADWFHPSLGLWALVFDE